MKKLILALSFLILSLASYAQEKGDFAAGIDIGVAPTIEKNVSLSNFGIGAKFQYNVTDPIRLEFDINYWFRDKQTDILDLDINAQYLFHVANRLSAYPLAGIGYARVGLPTTPENRFLFNVGAGAEYFVSQNVSTGLEFKFQFMKHYSRIPINIGVTYHF